MNEATKTLDHIADQAAAKADRALSATKRAANGALDSLQHGVDALQDQAPGALSRAAAQVDELTQRGVERARQAAADVRLQAERAGDRTVGYIRDEPVKSMLIAAAAGAAITALIAALSRGRKTAA